MICKICEKPTENNEYNHAECWELEKRISRNPALTKKLLTKCVIPSTVQNLSIADILDLEKFILQHATNINEDAAKVLFKLKESDIDDNYNSTHRALSISVAYAIVRRTLINEYYNAAMYETGNNISELEVTLQLLYMSLPEFAKW